MPLKAAEQARTVISMEAIEVYHKQSNKAGLYYGQNIMPTNTGYTSVGFTQIIPPVTPATIFFSDVRTVFSQDRTRVNLAWSTIGDVYALGPDATDWVKLTGTPAVPVDFDVNDITIGTVNGVSYIFYKQQGLYTLDFAGTQLVAQALPALTVGDILGVAASSGYLLAYSVNALYWSSLLDPTDFAPSQISGAGGGNVSDIDGDIVFATSHSRGVVIYSEANAVMATYSGNKRYPFNLKELPASKGGISLDLIAYEANSDAQFVYTTGGMQLVSGTQAEVILPEVTDFLAGKVIEEFDTTTATFSSSSVSSLKKKVKLIASRYLVISYGENEFTQAIVYDLALKRMGKLHITHKDVFEYIGSQDEIAKENICFLLDTGEVQYADFTSGDGVLILGKLQLRRGRMTTLLQVEAENCTDGTLYDLPALDGKLLDTPVEGFLSNDGDSLKTWLFRQTAKEHTLALIGTFDANTILCRVQVHGRR